MLTPNLAAAVEEKENEAIEAQKKKAKEQIDFSAQRSAASTRFTRNYIDVS